MQSLPWLCNVTKEYDLPDIWNTVPPLKNNRARASTELDCQRTVDSLHLRPPCTPHSVAVMVLELAFHTKDPDRVGDTVNIFLFPYLSLSVGL